MSWKSVYRVFLGNKVVRFQSQQMLIHDVKSITQRRHPDATYRGTHTSLIPALN